MYLGIDVGTSGVKTVLCTEAQRLVAQSEAPLSVSRPHSLWSEQDPEAWWQGVETTIQTLRAAAPEALSAVKGIGLSGQMHGATLT